MRMLILWIIMILTIPAWAQESSKACTGSGDKVTCSREGFDKLVKGFVDQRATTEKLIIELDAAKAAIADRDKAMVALQKNTQDLAREHKFYVAKSHLAVGSAVLGTALMGVAAVGSLPDSVRLVSAAAGIAGAAFSVVIIW